LHQLDGLALRPASTDWRSRLPAAIMLPMPPAATDWPADPFWDWSLAAYARPGVARALLALQDEQGLDVNLMLFCVWAAAAGPGPLSPGEVAAARAAVAHWRSEMLEPLRALRRACTAGQHALAPGHLVLVRKSLQLAELEAEHAAQLRLSASLTRRRPGGPDLTPLAGAAAGLRQLLVLESIEPAPAVLAQLATVLAACLADTDEEAARQALGQAC